MRSPSRRVVTSTSQRRPARPRQGRAHRTTSYQYDANGRLTRTTAPEGNYVQLTYDARGNVTADAAVAKTARNSGRHRHDGELSRDLRQPGDLQQAEQRPRTPEQPVTDYTYDATHGGVLTVTAPAPDRGAVRPQTRYSLTALTSGGAAKRHLADLRIGLPDRCASCAGRRRRGQDDASPIAASLATSTRMPAPATAPAR